MYKKISVVLPLIVLVVCAFSTVQIPPFNLAEFHASPVSLCPGQKEFVTWDVETFSNYPVSVDSQDATKILLDPSIGGAHVWDAKLRLYKNTGTASYNVWIRAYDENDHLLSITTFVHSLIVKETWVNGLYYPPAGTEYLRVEVEVSQPGEYAFTFAPVLLYIYNE